MLAGDVRANPQLVPVSPYLDVADPRQVVRIDWSMSCMALGAGLGMAEEQ